MLNLFIFGGIGFLVGILLFILPIIALIDIIRSEFYGSNKLVWILIVLFLNTFGAILYFILGRSQKIKRGRYYH